MHSHLAFTHGRRVVGNGHSGALYYSADGVVGGVDVGGDEYGYGEVKGLDEDGE